MRLGVENKQVSLPWRKPISARKGHYIGGVTVRKTFATIY
jgi:hypothetical protein